MNADPIHPLAAFFLRTQHRVHQHLGATSVRVMTRQWGWGKILPFRRGRSARKGDNANRAIVNRQDVKPLQKPLKLKDVERVQKARRVGHIFAQNRIC